MYFTFIFSPFLIFEMNFSFERTSEWLSLSAKGIMFLGDFEKRFSKIIFPEANCINLLFIILFSY